MFWTRTLHGVLALRVRDGDDADHTNWFKVAGDERVLNQNNIFKAVNER